MKYLILIIILLFIILFLNFKEQFNIFDSNNTLLKSSDNAYTKEKIIDILNEKFKKIDSNRNKALRNIDEEVNKINKIIQTKQSLFKETYIKQKYSSPIILSSLNKKHKYSVIPSVDNTITIKKLKPIDSDNDSDTAGNIIIEDITKLDIGNNIIIDDFNNETIINNQTKSIYNMLNKDETNYLNYNINTPEIQLKKDKKEKKEKNKIITINNNKNFILQNINYSKDSYATIDNNKFYLDDAANKKIIFGNTPKSIELNIPTTFQYYDTDDSYVKLLGESV